MGRPEDLLHIPGEPDEVADALPRMGGGKGNMPFGMPVLGGGDRSFRPGKFFRQGVEGPDHPVPPLDRQGSGGPDRPIPGSIGGAKINLNIHLYEGGCGKVNNHDSSSLKGIEAPEHKKAPSL
jgi:hypothetical protein